MRDFPSEPDAETSQWLLSLGWLPPECVTDQDLVQAMERACIKYPELKELSAPDVIDALIHMLHMSLRDDFAGKAIGPLLSGVLDGAKVSAEDDFTWIARSAYELADEMMKARLRPDAGDHAHARLIAAAPAMHDALVNLTLAVKEGTSTEIASAWKEARAVAIEAMGSETPPGAP